VMTTRRRRQSAKYMADRVEQDACPIARFERVARNAALDLRTRRVRKAFAQLSRIDRGIAGAVAAERDQTVSPADRSATHPRTDRPLTRRPTGNSHATRLTGGELSRAFVPSMAVESRFEAIGGRARLAGFSVCSG
jgi:hypothetical protein